MREQDNTLAHQEHRPKNGVLVHHQRQTHVLLRGNAHTPGDAVEPATFTVLASAHALGAGEESATRLAVRPLRRSSGRRRALAEWITRDDHPLTAVGGTELLEYMPFFTPTI